MSGTLGPIEGKKPPKDLCDTWTRGHIQPIQTRAVDAPAQWYDTLGSTLGPPPYQDKSWVYLQDFLFQEVLVPGQPTLVLDGGTNFATYLHPVVYDGYLIGAASPPKEVIDGGSFKSTGGTFVTVREALATVSVYDSKASVPNTDGLYNIPVKSGESLRQAVFTDDIEPGTEIASLSYKEVGDTITILNWNSSFWYDSEPVIKAFQAIVQSCPRTVKKFVVANEPTAFWVAAGFQRTANGEVTLSVNRPIPKFTSY